MPEFAYRARTFAGDDIAGTLTANTQRDAFRALGEQSLFPLEVTAAEPARFPKPFSRRIKTQVLSTNLTQLSDLLASGVPLLKALDVLAANAVPPRLTEVLEDVRNQVAEGVTLDKALARHGDVFNELTISMIRAGLEGAFLEDALKRVAAFLQQQEALKARVLGAMTYPVILAIAGFTVTIVLLVFFVPKFSELFARLEARGGLPWATVALLWLSNVLGRYGLFVALAIGGTAWLLRKQALTPRGRSLIDLWKLRIPLAGPVFLGFAVSRFCRVLGTLLRNGVPLLKALRISSESTGNRLLEKAIRDAAQNVSSGNRLTQPLAQCGLFPRPVMAMISVAEESNNLDDVLINVADGMDRQTSQRLDLMVRMLEPLMLLIMAGIILFVLMALLLPVFEMSATVG